MTGNRSNSNNIITKNTFVILNTRGSIFDIVAPDSCFEIVLRLISVCFEIDFSLFEIDLIDYYFCLLVVCEHTQQIDLKIRKLYCATLLSFFFKSAISNMHWYSWHVVIMIKRGVSTGRFKNIRYFIRNLNFTSTSILATGSHKKYSTNYYKSLWKGWPYTKNPSIKFWLNLIKHWLKISQNLCKLLRVEEID